MDPFRIYTRKTAPKDSAGMLCGVEEALGFVPNVVGALGGTPAVLRAFVELNQRFAECSLTAAEREVVQLTVSVTNGCGYCVAGHTAFARSGRLSGHVITAVRNGGTIADPRLAALHRFTRAAVTANGNLDGREVERFLKAGYTSAQVREVILGIAVKAFSNLASNLLDIPLDEEFVPHAWAAAAASPRLHRERLAA